MIPPTARRRAMLGLPALAPALAPGLAAAPARAQAPINVDLMLVLAMDASASIDAEEFRLQREGLAISLTDPAIVQIAIGGRHRCIAVALVEWGSPGGAVIAVPWTVLSDAASAAAIAAAIRAAPRSPQQDNALGDAVALSITMIETAAYRSDYRVIDVAGDGPDEYSLTPAPVARDRAAARGITVNALAIELSDAGSGETLRAHFERDVIGGPDAFVMVAQTRADFTRAMRAKLLREIS